MKARPFAYAILSVVALAGPAQADEGVAALLEALRMPEVIAIMREEGIDYGAEISESMFFGARTGWGATVEEIYDADSLNAMFAQRFTEEMVERDATTNAAADFFTSDLGARVVDLELAARRAMLDDEVDEGARLTLGEMMAEEDPRLDQLRRFVEAGELLEENVVGGLNSTYAFYMGLVDSGAPGFDIGQSEILSDVWSQEPAIREDLEEWLHSYLALAYDPLSDAELDRYISFSETNAGRELNAALFAAFNGMFEAISGELGRAAGRVMQGQDI